MQGSFLTPWSMPKKALTVKLISTDRHLFPCCSVQSKLLGQKTTAANLFTFNLFPLGSADASLFLDFPFLNNNFEWLKMAIAPKWNYSRNTRYPIDIHRSSLLLLPSWRAPVESGIRAKPLSHQATVWIEFRPAVARGARAKMGRASSLRAAGAGRPRAAGQCPVRVQSRFFTFWYFDFLCISMSFKERLSFSSELLVYFNKCRYDTSCWGT